jgi:hypothetical protein
MQKFNKFALALLVLAVSAVSVCAETNSAAFDGAAAIGSAQTAVEGIGVAIGSLLGAAVVIYLGFLGYRKLREAMNKA